MGFRRNLTITAAVAASALVAAGCTTVPHEASTPPTNAPLPIGIDYAGLVKGPAAPVAGARTGGKITVLMDGDFSTLDPQQIYDSTALNYGQLFFRTLTGYIEHPDGTLQLVGDLATNAGTTHDGGKTWTYHLRSGIRFEDGNAITSRDVAYGIARSFSRNSAYGPQYLTRDLDPNHTYPGPYGGALIPPGVGVPDDQTITFTFPVAHPELPYLLAFTTSTPVPVAKDSKEKRVIQRP
jgi:peptide/nickel transport system substrate-binding protein